MRPLGTYVDKDTGRPLAQTHRGDQPKLDAAGHPFLKEIQIPRDHQPSNGQFRKWNFALTRWEADAELEQEHANQEQSKDDFWQGIRDKYAALEASIGTTRSTVEINAALDRIIELMPVMYKKLK